MGKIGKKFVSYSMSKKEDNDKEDMHNDVLFCMYMFLLVVTLLLIKCT